uniref:response regulator transcription factor n=1 Tax=Pedobacter sp. TaxID=1411316 RepID=UPI001598BF68|nr:helix-turn-helix transcriptional regulator [Pedobacter sp.]QJS06232.1 transcriptional regulator, LuxR family, hth domain [Pedobacter sp.]
MKVLHTEMELITLIFLISESILFLYQLVFYLERPFEKKRLYYLIFLFLFVAYNLLGGLFPDPEINLPIALQNILAYGTGFAVGCYFPFYFYKAYDLKFLAFHMRFGVLSFLVVPFLLFLVIEYSLKGDLNKAVKHGMIIPFFYALSVMYDIFRGIRSKYKEDNQHTSEMILTYISILPWVSLPVLTYFQAHQFIEVLAMNCGFLIISFLFFWQTVQQNKLNNSRLVSLLLEINKPSENVSPFDSNCARYKLTNRELEVTILIRKGLKYKEIAASLFISERTVTKHVQNMFFKVGVTNKFDLIKALEKRELLQKN